MRDIIALTTKDLRIQFRSRESLSELILLGLLLVAILGIVLEPGSHDPESLAAATIWVVLSLITVVNVDRAFSIEREGDNLWALRLTGVGSAKIVASKLLSSLFLVSIACGVIVPATLLVFKVSQPSVIAPLFVIVFLGAAGCGAIGIMLAALHSQSDSGEGFLTVILLPLLLPIIIFGVKATRTLLLHASMTGVIEPLGYIAVYDAAFIAVLLLLCDRVLED